MPKIQKEGDILSQSEKIYFDAEKGIIPIPGFTPKFPPFSDIVSGTPQKPGLFFANADEEVKTQANSPPKRQDKSTEYAGYAPPSGRKSLSFPENTFEDYGGGSIWGNRSNWQQFIRKRYGMPKCSNTSTNQFYTMLSQVERQLDFHTIRALLAEAF